MLDEFRPGKGKLGGVSPRYFWLDQIWLGLALLGQLNPG
jgi:hypothetical protein